MSEWVQPLHPTEVAPFVFDCATGVTLQQYPVGLLRLSPLPHQPTVQVVFIAEVDNKVLVAFPGSVWNRSKAFRVLPNGWITKATAVEVAVCSLDEREVEVEGLTVQIWVGYLKPDLIARVDFSLTDIATEYTFEADCAALVLPYAKALAEATNEHFAFFSATDGMPSDMADGCEEAPEELGLPEVSAKIVSLEDQLHQLTSSVQMLVELQKPPQSRPSALRTTAKSSSPIDARVKFAPKPKPQSRKVGAPEEFPTLDAGVVRAALQAGVSRQSLEQMSRLVSKNPKGAKLADLNPALSLDPLSEDEEGEADQDGDCPLDPDDGSALHSGDPVQSAVMKLTDIVQTLSEDRRKKSNQSTLDAALDQVSGASVPESSGLGYGKRSAAARRSLRALLNDNPADIYGFIERLMWEDISSQTLGPGISAPASSARAWLEHRSRIGSYRTLAHSSWGVAGALDALMQSQVASARARLCVLLLQLDQSAIDQGSWYLAAELGLEAGPPMSALEQHRLPNLQAGEAPYSRLLDSRWAEICMTHLREQEDFVNRRKNLGKVAPKKEAEDEGDAPRRRPKAKPKAKAASEPTA